MEYPASDEICLGQPMRRGLKNTARYPCLLIKIPLPTDFDGERRGQLEDDVLTEYFWREHLVRALFWAEEVRQGVSQV
jgi:hypothetical protein